MLDYFIQSPWNFLLMLASEKENKGPYFPSASLWMLPNIEVVFPLWGARGVSLTQRHLRTFVKSISWSVFAHLEKQTAKWIFNNERGSFPFLFCTNIKGSHIPDRVTPPAVLLNLQKVALSRYKPAESLPNCIYLLVEINKKYQISFIFPNYHMDLAVNNPECARLVSRPIPVFKSPFPTLKI